MTTTSTDPGAIDLELYKQRRTERYPDEDGSYDGPIEDSDDDIDALIAAVEALRARVVELAEHLDKVVGVSADAVSRAEAAEARVVELTGALGDLLKETKEALIGLFGDSPDDPFESQSIIKHATAILAATTAQAMERARAVEKVVQTAKKVVDTSLAWLNKVALGNELADALIALDALGKENKEDA
ncbi:hypothetical protein IID24_04040 [Patescibacteria group bacterium]|nr:hypothetical protein [Patescibacteria group bacterium]